MWGRSGIRRPPSVAPSSHRGREIIYLRNSGPQIAANLPLLFWFLDRRCDWTTLSDRGVRPDERATRGLRYRSQPRQDLLDHVAQLSLLRGVQCVEPLHVDLEPPLIPLERYPRAGPFFSAAAGPASGSPCRHTASLRGSPTSSPSPSTSTVMPTRTASWTTSGALPSCRYRPTRFIDRPVASESFSAELSLGSRCRKRWRLLAASRRPTALGTPGRGGGRR